MLLMIIFTFIDFIIDEIHTQRPYIDYGGKGGKHHNVDDSSRLRRRYLQEAAIKVEIFEPEERAIVEGGKNARIVFEQKKWEDEGSRNANRKKAYEKTEEERKAETVEEENEVYSKTGKAK